MWSVAVMMVLHVVRGCYGGLACGPWLLCGFAWVRAVMMVLHVVRGCYDGLACGPWLLWWSCMWSVAVIDGLACAVAVMVVLACGPWLL